MNVFLGRDVKHSVLARLVLLLTLATALSAAVIRGSIVENRTGKPLARATVTLQPIAGTPGTPATSRTDRFGAFEFQNLAGGTYVLRASQRGFLPLEYGQKLWNSAGQPIVVAADASAFLNLRMLRYGGITGAILDENDIGLWGHDVVAYRNAQPLQLATRATSDDRGVYRISGLEPGVYLVRTVGAQDEQISYVPTFGKETQEVLNARIVQVFPDEDATGMDIRPAAGKLLTLSGTVDIDLDYCPTDVIVTLASEMGRRTVEGRCVFQFASLPPGPYELHAWVPSVIKGAYTQVSLKADTSVSLVARDVRTTQVDIVPSTIGGPGGMQITARRKDLAGVGPAAPLQLANGRVLLPPGRWEVFLNPPSGYYVSGFFASSSRGIQTRPDGWNEFLSSGNFRSIRFSLTGGPSEIHGTIKSYGEIVAGAPVFLEGWDPDTRKRVTDLRVARTDGTGVYRFQGLAPGTYRILSTFEYLMPDSASMDLAAAQSVRLEPHSSLQMDLDLYGIR